MIIATWPEKVNSNGTGFSNVWKSERASFTFASGFTSVHLSDHLLNWDCFLNSPLFPFCGPRAQSNSSLPVNSGGFDA